MQGLLLAWGPIRYCAARPIFLQHFHAGDPAQDRPRPPTGAFLQGRRGCSPLRWDARWALRISKAVRLLAVALPPTVCLAKYGKSESTSERVLANLASRYWQSLLYFFIGLTVLELLLAPFSGIYPAYSSFIGYVGLSVEATLPIPQLLANARTRTSRGLRVSVLASWIIGDMMKMFWFFTSTTEIPWSFKICGMFQAGCDLLLGVQYLMWGNGEATAGLQQRWTYAGVRPHLQGRSDSGLGSPMMAMDRRSPFAEKTT